MSAGQAGGDWAGEFTGKAGSTVLDQLHQSMILFAVGSRRSNETLSGRGRRGTQPAFLAARTSILRSLPGGNG